METAVQQPDDCKHDVLFVLTPAHPSADRQYSHNVSANSLSILYFPCNQRTWMVSGPMGGAICKQDGI